MSLYSKKCRKTERFFIRTYEETYSIHEGVVVCYIRTTLYRRTKDGHTHPGISFVGKGVAKCAPEDKFNAAVGMKIAAARAEIHYYSFYKKALKDMLEEMKSSITPLEALINECDDQIIHDRCVFIPSLVKE